MSKICFIISSIGGDGTEIRKSADEKYDFVYEPVLKELNYEPVRADKETTPNSISRDIISRIISSDLLLADVTDENPNVFYELAVRNAVKKPVIIIKASGQRLPFDIQDKRAITLNMQDNRQWLRAKDLLKDYIKNAEDNPNNASVSILTDFQFDLATDNLKGKQEKELDITLSLKDIRDGINRLTSIVNSLQKSDPISESPSGFPRVNVNPWPVTGSISSSTVRLGNQSLVDYVIVDSSEILGDFGFKDRIKVERLNCEQFIKLIYDRLLRDSNTPMEYGKTWILRNIENTRVFIIDDYDKPLTDVGIFPGMYLVITKLPHNFK